jgi:hypothetical protein
VSLADRVSQADSSGAELFVGLYCNASRDRSIHGTTTYYFHPGAKHFAQVLENDVAKEIGLSNDGVMKDDLYVIKNTKSSMPDVLIEYAYISNLHEEKLLSNSAFLDRIAGAAARAIERYFAVQTPGTFVHAVSPEEKSSLARISSVLPTNGTLELESSSPPSVRISPSSVPGKIENQPEVLNFRTCIGR